MKPKTLSILSLFVAVVLVGGAFVLVGATGSNNKELKGVAEVNNVSVENGKQIIDIKAKGGYSPILTTAKAGMPTILRFSTEGTFDCSSTIRIPSMNITKNLPQSGKTDIDIGNSEVATLQGTCGMGMYRFQVNFKS